jgi:hypothetical protein
VIEKPPTGLFVCFVAQNLSTGIVGENGFKTIIRKWPTHRNGTFHVVLGLCNLISL